MESGGAEQLTTGRRRRLHRGLGLLCGLVVAFVIGEAVVRVLDLPPRPLPRLAAGYYELSPNRLLKFRYRPGTLPEDIASPGDHLGFRINSAGFRDVEHEVINSEGRHRIVVLGDSITAGVGVSDPESVFTRRLERLLNARQGARSCEVINLGVGGYHTLQETETLRVAGLGYRPDHVVVAFCVNDLAWDSDGQVLEELRNQLPPEQQSVLLRGWRSSGLVDFVVSQSRLGFFVYHRFNRLDGFLDLEWRRESRSGQVGTPLRLGLEQLESLAAEGGFGCHLFLVPAFDRPFHEYAHADLHQRVREQAAGWRGLTVVDLLEEFGEQEIEAFDLSHDGLHPNRAGHEILATLMHRHLAPIVTDGGSEGRSR